MENARNILAAPDVRVVAAGSRQPLQAAIGALKRMRSRRRVTCVARRVEPGLSRTLACRATRCYRTFGGAVLAERRPSLSVRA